MSDKGHTVEISDNVSTLSENQHSLEKLLIESGILSDREIDQLKTQRFYRSDYFPQLLLIEGLMSRNDYKELMTTRLGFQYVDLVGKHIEREIATKLRQTFISKYQALPIKIQGDILVVAMLNPLDSKIIQEIEKKTDLNVHPVFSTDVDLNWQYHQLFGKSLVHRAVYNLFWQDPESSAANVVLPRQTWAFIGIIGVVLFCLTMHPAGTLIVISVLINLLYICSIIFKFALTIAGVKSEMLDYVSKREVRKLKDEDLPIYTILIPLFKESAVLPKLNYGLMKLNYPTHRLDIKLLLEQDDLETLNAIKQFTFPAVFDFVIVPNFGPRTKPKACNYGLYCSKGKFLTVYDAEDIPDPDQLKKVVVLFNRESEDVVCVQAALNYYNATENFLTRMFTLEYSYWFDYMLRGMERLKVPIPLGGTSNHFRVDKLRELGGWDPFNVTEDADLGIRASVRGYRVMLVNSTTYEEANRALGNWIRQRSRWIKGYMQTWLVHSRSPIKLIKQIGIKSFLGYNFFIGGTPLIFIINPFLWGLYFFWLIFRMDWIRTYFPPVVLYMALFNLLIGNVLIVYMNMLAVFKRRNYNLTFFALLNPFYWWLHSIASLKALWQLVQNPFYWEKTTHGISKTSSKISIPKE
jgi:hypothetical protein